MERLTNAYVKGRIEESYYDEEYTKLKSLIDEAESKKDTGRKTNAGSIRKIFDENWKASYLLLDRQNRKAFWQSIIDHIELDDDKTVKGVFFL